MFFLSLNNYGRALDNRAGRKTVRAGRSAPINMPSWNTETNHKGIKSESNWVQNETGDNMVFTESSH